MTEQEEKFIHFSLCIRSLNNAWRLLQAIQMQPENQLGGAAFRFALIEYCKPYRLSRGSRKQFKLDTSLISPEHIALHDRIIASRDQVQAHSDLTVLDAKLHVHQIVSLRHTLISQNYITGLEEFPNIQRVIALIESSLDNMYSEVKVLEAALPH